MIKVDISRVYINEVIHSRGMSPEYLVKVSGILFLDRYCGYEGLKDIACGLKKRDVEVELVGSLDGWVGEEIEEIFTSKDDVAV